MKTYFKHLHSQMLIEINHCKRQQQAEIKTTEGYYKIACRYWEKAKGEFLNRIDIDYKTEIEFFKEVKPKFTCHIEYSLILYMGLLFVPTHVEDEIKYWNEEKERINYFFKKNKPFIDYYNSSQCNLDSQYFLKRIKYDIFPKKEVIYSDKDCRSLHDHLIRSYLARKMYYDYIQERVNKLIHPIIISNLKQVKSCFG